MSQDYKIATLIVSSNTYPATRNSKIQKNIDHFKHVRFKY